MSNTHSQLSRIGLLMQAGRRAPGFPGWTRPWIKALTGNTSGKVSANIATAQQSIPRWMRTLTAGEEILSREFIHDLTRYPDWVELTHVYTVDFDIDGSDTVFSWKFAWSSLYRNSHRGYDRGGLPCKVTITGIHVTGTDGSTRTYEAGRVLLEGKQFGGTTIGWRSGQVGGTINYGKPIQTVNFIFTYYGGREIYHDVGDGSQWEQKPGITVGTDRTNALLNYDTPLLNNHWNAPQSKKVTDFYRRYRTQTTTPAVLVPYDQWPGRATIERYVPPARLAIINQTHDHERNTGGDHSNYSYRHTSPVGSSESWNQICTDSWSGGRFSGGPTLIYYGAQTGTKVSARNVATGAVVNLNVTVGSMPGRVLYFDGYLEAGSYELTLS